MGFFERSQRLHSTLLYLRITFYHMQGEHDSEGKLHKNIFENSIWVKRQRPLNYVINTVL